MKLAVRYLIWQVTFLAGLKVVQIAMTSGAPLQVVGLAAFVLCAVYVVWGVRLLIDLFRWCKQRIVASWR